MTVVQEGKPCKGKKRFAVPKGVRISDVVSTFQSDTGRRCLSADSTLDVHGLSSKQIITSVKAAFSEVTDHDAYVEVLHQIDDALHDITEHHDLRVLPKKADGKKLEAHERAGHIPKDSACPACIRESGSRVQHYKGQERLKNLIMELCLRVKLTEDSSALLPWYVPLEDESQPVVADAVFKVVNQISQCKHLRQFEGCIVRRIFSDGEHVFDNPIFKKRALDLGIGVYKSPPYQPQSSGIAERLVGMSKMLVKRLLESTSLTSAYWNNE
eukprot:5764235-Amphidinium_carterae.3